MNNDDIKSYPVKRDGTVSIVCPQCGGTGQYMSEADSRYSWQIPDDANLTCDMCRGVGVVERKKEFISEHDQIVEDEK